MVRKPVGIYGCGFCLLCSAIRKEEGRLSHTLAILFLRSTFAQPYPLSMARAKEERRKYERRAKEGRVKGVLDGSESLDLEKAYMQGRFNAITYINWRKPSKERRIWRNTKSFLDGLSVD